MAPAICGGHFYLVEGLANVSTHGYHEGMKIYKPLSNCLSPLEVTLRLRVREPRRGRGGNPRRARVRAVPNDNPVGRWTCVVDKENYPNSDWFNFLEAHPSDAWKFVVFRISNYNFDQGISLGDCVMLNKEQATQLRDRLNELLKEME